MFEFGDYLSSGGEGRVPSGYDLDSWYSSLYSILNMHMLICWCTGGSQVVTFCSAASGICGMD